MPHSIDLKITGAAVYVEHSGSHLYVEVSSADQDEVLKEFTTEALLDHVGKQAACEYFDLEPDPTI
jgi:hypothetical protein